MTVKELVAELSKFPDDMPVCDTCYDEIENVDERTWEDTNYPYNKPDKQILVLW